MHFVNFIKALFSILILITTYHRSSGVAGWEGEGGSSPRNSEKRKEKEKKEEKERENRKKRRKKGEKGREKGRERMKEEGKKKERSGNSMKFN